MKKKIKDLTLEEYLIPIKNCPNCDSHTYALCKSRECLLNKDLESEIEVDE